MASRVRPVTTEARDLAGLPAARLRRRVSEVVEALADQGHAEHRQHDGEARGTPRSTRCRS